MVRFTINLEVMSKVGAQSNETFRGAKKFHEMQKRDKDPVKTNSSKTNSSFERVGNITSAS